MNTLQTNYPVHFMDTNEAVIELSGDLTSRFSELIEADFSALISYGVTKLLIDFSKVRYINSTGVAVLIKLVRLSRNGNMQLRASGLSEHYHEIFKITRLGDYITVVS